MKHALAFLPAAEFSLYEYIVNYLSVPIMEKEERTRSNSKKQSALKNLFLSSQKEKSGIQHNDSSKAKIGELDGSLPLSPSTEQIKINSSSPSRNSPDPSCAICLGQLENKSFTDSCFHTFCFTCLLEWSKVKPECPLCKQHFESIVYNVRSIEDYDQYHISKNGESSWRSPDGQRFRYSSTLTTDRLAERRRRAVFEHSSQEYLHHRSTYAPHSIGSQSSRSFITDHPSTSLSRRQIYENGLWVKPLRHNGDPRIIRRTSPEFLRQNPACTHRLTPWLNRELLALLHDSESQVTFVLELILALIMRYDIRSQEFYVHIQPYLQDRTSHFIHEFYNYASAPCDMYNYDNSADYERLESFVDISASVLSSPGSDVVALPTPDIVIPESPPSSSRVHLLTSSKRHNKRKNKNPFRCSTKLFLRRNQENDLWQSVSPSYSQHGLCGSSSVPGESVEMSRPSTSGIKRSRQVIRIPMRFTRPNSSCSESDDCIIVDVVKPKALRTPELVSLISSSEDERNDFSALHGNSPLNSNSENTEPMEGNSKASMSFKEENSRKTLKCDYKSYGRLQENYEFSLPSTSKECFKGKDITNGAETLSSSMPQKYPSTSVSSSRSRSTSGSRSRSRDPKSSSQSPRSKSKHDGSQRSKYHNSSSTDSSTESNLSEGDFQSRGLCMNETTKVKLKSVVWRFSSTESQCSRNEYNYRGKKHKHKKKKKHGKHKRHRQSNSSDNK